MMKLQKSDRVAVEAHFRQNRWETFYHYFPLMYAISESTEPIFIKEDYGEVYGIHTEDEQYYLMPQYSCTYLNYRKKLTDAGGVLVSPQKCPIKGWSNELYDVNYIYDLDYTLGIRNFRKNVKKFEKAHPDTFYGEEPFHADDVDPWEIVKKWYQVSKRKEFTDFGYTEWLTHNFEQFEDLKARVGIADGQDVAFSLWGIIRPGLGIHLICKDIGWPYLQDYTRYRTYQEMKETGLNYCNDGSDAGENGIRVFKTKLRPKFITPIYSWIREA